MKTLNRFRFVITSLLLFCSVLYFSGCYSSYTTTIEPEQIPAEKEYEFVSLNLKDSTLINLEGKNAKYYNFYNGKQNVIAFPETKTFILKNDTNKVSSTMLRLCLLSDLSNAKIEKQKLNPAETVLLTTGIVAVIALLVALCVALANMDSLSFGSMGKLWEIKF